jgi:acyl-homoserine lactone acylase PvdQ
MKATEKKPIKQSVKQTNEQTVLKKEKKSKFALWWESYEPIIEIVDMRAVLK